jgi:hypothetical protein
MILFPNPRGQEEKVNSLFLYPQKVFLIDRAVEDGKLFYIILDARQLERRL